MIQIFVITPGEINGIGLEVTLKALAKIARTPEAYRDKAFVFFSNKSTLNEHLNLLSTEIEHLKIEQIRKLTTKLAAGFYWINSNEPPFEWFKKTTEFCYAEPKRTALITGPLKKSSFRSSNAAGHTDYLRQTFKGPCFMTFFGSVYNLLLLSDHLPLAEATKLNFSNLLTEALQILQNFSFNKKVALLGLNPHAGENGLIGNTEEIHHKIFAKASIQKVDGPLPADAFFSLDSYKKYSFLIANYHDQGLIPFKLIHGFNAAQASLGLPFVRTSVDHGTGDSLFLKNQADASSMKRAIDLAIELLKIKQEA